MLKILVTGATGFIGKHLVPQLIAAGYDVRCAVWQKVDWISAPQIIINKLESQMDWSVALQDIDVVIHLAARVHVMKDTKASSLDTYCKINSDATKHFAEQAAKHKVKRFIFLSTIKVNGESTSPLLPFTENQSASAEDPYAKSKYLAEQYLKEISQSTGLDVVILRPPLVYGPGVKANFLKMLQLVHRGWPLPFANINNQRNFIYIDNLVSVFFKVLTDPAASNQLFLVADNEGFSLSQLLRILSKEMQTKLVLFPIPYKLLSVFLNTVGLKHITLRLFGSLLVSNDKIKTTLNWEPPVTAEEGLRKTVEWYRHDYPH